MQPMGHRVLSFLSFFFFKGHLLVVAGFIGVLLRTLPTNSPLTR